MKRTVVITGAASGIGKATYDMVCSRNWHAIGIDLKDTDICADLSTVEGRAISIEAVKDQSRGAIDALIVCAGISSPEPITVSVNYFGAIAMLEGLQPLLKKGLNPRAVAISSLAASLPLVDEEIVDACLRGDEASAKKAAKGKAEGIYISSKAALALWIRRRSITQEWAGSGILLNAIAPGLIATPMTQEMINDPAQLAQYKESLPIPLSYYGQPEYVAELLTFLASPQNSFMVGQVIYIDGGTEASIRGGQVW